MSSSNRDLHADESTGLVTFRRLGEPFSALELPAFAPSEPIYGRAANSLTLELIYKNRRNAVNRMTIAAISFRVLSISLGSVSLK